jgi:osmotically-inducible protein OsmY
MKAAALGSVVVAAALIAAAPAAASGADRQTQATTTTTTTSDASLGSKIEKKLHDSTLKKYDVKVTVNNGVATLTGTVPTEADRRKAAQLATMNGIARVDNQIVVDLDAGHAPKGTTGKIDKAADKTEKGVDKAADKTQKGVDKAIDKSAEGISKATEKSKEGASTAYEKSKEGAATAADKSAQGISKAGEAITDVWIKARVKSKFVDEDVLKGSDISVDVNDHVVTLSGTVPSEAGRLRAIEEAKKVDGVHQVIDRMTIGPKK